ncbi:winged helix-turn-helix domain-containing protein [Chloroflexota bacterium]
MGRDQGQQMAKIPSFKPKKPSLLSRTPEPGYSLRGRVWMERDGEFYLGRGRVLLLEAIARYGSIAAAAREMHLSYRNAWLWVEATNRLAPEPLVEKTTGGSHGGTARLTEKGAEEVARYKKIWQDYQSAVNQIEQNNNVRIKQEVF